MDSCLVQDLFAALDPQEPYRLFIRFGSQSLHFLELRFAGERTVLIPVRDDILGDGLAETSDVLEQRIAGGVHIHSDAIHDIFDLLIQFFFEIFLIDIMLILADADGFRIDFR